jgi:hypothetical protein
VERRYLKDGASEEVSRNDSLICYKQAYNDFEWEEMLSEKNYPGKEQSTFPSILRITFQQVITWLGALGGGIGGMKRAYRRGSKDMKSRSSLLDMTHVGLLLSPMKTSS